MGAFSAGAAIGAGFRLIGREPVAFLVWCLVMLLVGVLPQGWVMSQFFGMFGQFAELAGQGQEKAPIPAEMFQMQAKMLQLQPISYAASIVSHTLILGAVFRATLLDGGRNWFFLRLGSRELWLGLVVLVMAVLLLMGFFAFMIPGLVVAGVAAATKAEAVVVAGPFVMLIGFGVATWLLLRLSLAPMMSFTRNTFLLFESWSLTRGHALRMFGVGLALAILLWLLELLLAGAAFGVIVAQGPLEQAFAADPHDSFAFFARLGWGFWAGVGVAWACFTTFTCTIFGAAWAEIYRSLEQAPPPLQQADAATA